MVQTVDCNREEVVVVATCDSGRNETRLGPLCISRRIVLDHNRIIAGERFIEDDSVSETMNSRPVSYPRYIGLSNTVKCDSRKLIGTLT